MEHLVDQLKAVDRYDERAEEARQDFNETMGWYEQLTGYTNLQLEDGSLPQIDIPTVQKNLLYKRLERNEPNQVLTSGVLQRQSIEETLRELNEVNRGWRKYVPHRKDEAHNKRVSDLDELIGSGLQYLLGKNGLFYLDNPIISSTAFLSAGLPLGLVLQYLSHGGIDPKITALSAGGLLLLGGIAGGMVANVKEIDEDSSYFTRAKYLDEKIGELF